MFSNFKEYNENIENFATYIKRLEQNFLLHDVKEEKKVPALISCMGPKLYNLLIDLCFPTAPENKNYIELVDILIKHLHPVPNKISERIKFRKCMQFPSETTADFAARLKKFTANCQFADTLNENLLEQFLRGLHNENTQSKLLTEVEQLTFEKAVDQAVVLETAEKDIQELKNLNLNVNKIQKSSKYENSKQNVSNAKNSSVNKKIYCYRCGNVSHLANICKYKNSICNLCKKMGHLGKVCRSGKNEIQKKKIHSIDTMNVLSINSVTSNEPIKISVYIEGSARADMEVDTGSAISTVPIKRFKRLFPKHKIFPPDVQLKTATGEIFKPCGYVNIDVMYKNIHKNLKLYLIRDDTFPLLFGRDWISAFNMFPVEVKAVNIHNTGNGFENLGNLLEDYSDLFTDQIGAIKGMEAELHLEKEATPIFCKARTVTYALRNSVNQEIQRLQDEGIIRPVSTSKWATPVVPVVKPNGKIRLCCDFKVTINKFLKVDKYPLPKIEDILATLGGGVHFSKIDLNQAYLQLPVEERSQELLTINTPKGLFQYTKLPYGLSSSPAIWQRTIEQILSGIEGISVFIDDICISGETDEIHLKRLKQVLERLREYNVKINKEKSFFMANEITYCGYKIDKEGIHKTQDKIEAILNAPRPSTVSQVKAFLGLVSYYSKFVPNLSTLAYPLNKLLKKNIPFKWSSACENSFKNIKKEIISERVLTHFNPKLSLILATDASPYGISAVLSHIMPDKTEKPIAFASRTLTDAEKKYSQGDKEALSIVFGVKKFFQFLYGRRFTLFTDSKALVSIFSPTKSIPVLAAARMQRYAIYLQTFQYDIRYKKTTEHGNADALSRLPLRSEDLPPPQLKFHEMDEAEIFQINQISSLPLSPKTLALATKSDPTLSKIFYNLISGTEIPKDLLFGGKQEEYTLQHGCILRGCRIIIPQVHQKKILNELHYGHFGIVKMKALARSFVWWPGIDKDIEQLAQNCTTCINLKNNPAKINTHHWEWPTTPWERIHIDYFGPFQGKMFFLVVDAHSKWPEVFIVSKSTAEYTIACLSSLFARYGYPISLVSDNGPQFSSEEFKRFLRNSGVKHRFSAPYHPATNGQAERYVQTLKRGIKSLLSESGTLQEKLNNFLQQYRKMPHSTTGESPAYLFLKRNIRTKIDLIRPDISELVHDKQNKRLNKSKFREFQVNQKVAVRNYTPEAKWKTGVIIAREGKLHYKVRVGSNVWKRHIDQITNIGDNVPIQGDTSFEENNAQTYREEEDSTDASVPLSSVPNSLLKPLVKTNQATKSNQLHTPDPSPADFSINPNNPDPPPANLSIHPNTTGPSPADFPINPNTPDLSAEKGPPSTPDENTKLIYSKSTNPKFSSNNSSFYSQGIRRSQRRRKPPERLAYKR